MPTYTVPGTIRSKLFSKFPHYIFHLQKYSRYGEEFANFSYHRFPLPPGENSLKLVHAPFFILRLLRTEKSPSLCAEVGGRYFGPLSAAQRTTEMIADQLAGKNSGPALADYRNGASAIPLLCIFWPIFKNIMDWRTGKNSRPALADCRN
jgi:hypothetical protein